MKAKHLLLFILPLIPLFLLRDFTPDNELRYLSIADEALRNGTLFSFYNHGLQYADKPPLYLWIIMAGKQLLGTHSMWFLGLFSLIPALVILFVMDKWTAGVVDRKYRVTGWLLLFTTAYFLGAAATIRMDMLMCMFIVLALHTFYRIYTGQRTWRNRILLPVWIFLALFTKGPIGFLVPLLSIVAFLILKRELKTFGKYWEWITWEILLGACTLWFGAVYAEGGESYLHNLLFNQTVNRAVDAFHHKRPFFYYLETIWYVMAPWSLLIAGITVQAIRKKLIETDLERLFSVVIVVTLVMLSLISSKVDVYLLPIIPFLVYLAVILLQKMEQGALLRWLLALPVLLIILEVPASWMLLKYSGEHLPSFGVSGYLIGGFIVVTESAVLLLLYKKTEIRKVTNLFASSILVLVFFLSFLVPKMNDRIGYGELCREGTQIAHRQQQSPEFYFYNIRRGENMDVYLHQAIKELRDSDMIQVEKLHGILFYRENDVEGNRLLHDVVEGKISVRKGDYAIATLR